MSKRPILTIGAGLALAVGLLLGLVPVYSGRASCGSPFVGSGTGAFLYPTDGIGCTSARSARTVVTWIVLLAGVALGLAAWSVERKSEEPPTHEDAADVR